MKKCIGLLFILCVLLNGCAGDSVAETEVITLSLAVHAGNSRLSSSDLFKAVTSFNENSENVKIEIHDYLDNYNDPFEALNQIKIETAAGRGPDIINFGFNLQYSPLDASSGMLADLYPLMKNDSSFDRADYFCNIIDSFKIGESLYVLVPTYAISSFVTTSEKLSGLEKMDIATLIDAYETRKEGMVLYPGEFKGDVFGKICYGSMENFVDWNNGICHFDSDSFKDILRFANKFPLSLVMGNDYSILDDYQNGRAVLYSAYIGNVFETAKIRTLLGETPTYIGYPIDQGYGNMTTICDMAIGIGSTCKNKEEAWQFLRYLLDDDFQENRSGGLPLSVSILEQEIETALVAEYDENGNKAVKSQIRFEGEAPIEIFEIMDEDAKSLRNVLDKVQFNASLDYSLYNILLEEVAYLFNDNRDIDAVAGIIQNRASIYISEGK